MSSEADKSRLRFSLGQLLACVGAAAVGLALLARMDTEAVGIILLVWLMHALLAAALSAPIVFFGRRRVHWRWLDLSALCLPYAVWSALIVCAVAPKTLANLIEPFYLSFCIPLAALIRVAIGNRVPEWICRAVLVAALCFVAAAIFWMVPALPE